MLIALCSILMGSWRAWLRTLGRAEMTLCLVLAVALSGGGEERQGNEAGTGKRDT